MWTSTKLANRVARAEGLDEDAKTRLHRVFRNMVTKGVFDTETDEDDARSTRLFDDAKAAVALLLLPMAELAMDVRGLRDAAGSMLALDHDGKARIASAMQAVRDGSPVELVTTLTRYRGELHRTTFFKIEEPTGEAADILADFKAIAIETLATITIPVNARLRPLLSE